MNRLAIRPFTFSNGVTIPAGTTIAAPACAIHMDEEIYSDPQQFDGFRFSKLSALDGDVAQTKHQAVTTSPKHLAFGLGRHAW
jgi:cytochrome P450